MSCIGMILGKNWNVSDVSKSSQKRVSHGFLLSGRQNVIWQTFGKHWQACKREVFHFYILFLLGFMSGLAAGQGSRFMSLGGKGAVPAYALTYLIYSLLFLSSLSSGFLFVCLFVCVEQIVSFSHLLVSLFLSSATSPPLAPSRPLRFHPCLVLCSPLFSGVSLQHCADLPRFSRGRVGLCLINQEVPILPRDQNSIV